MSNQKITDAPILRNVPGNYGMKCRGCGNIAFTFASMLPKEASVARRMIDNRMGYEALSQRGQNPSPPNQPLKCQHCCSTISFPHDQIPLERVQPVDQLRRSVAKEHNYGRAEWNAVPITDEFLGIQRTEGEVAPAHSRWSDAPEPSGLLAMYGSTGGGSSTPMLSEPAVDAITLDGDEEESTNEAEEDFAL
jgi:hypothetical protein